MTPLLSAAGITKRYGRTAVLEDVDFDLRSGEVHALVGENGAGKSTLIRILTGAARPDGGGVQLRGSPLPADPRHVHALGIRCVYQEFTLVADMTVAENVMLGREAAPFVRRDQERRLAEARLAELGASCRPDAVVGSLSVAQQQLVEIARALEGNAGVLILDEPTAALSSADVDRLLDVLRRLRGRGLGIVYVSHRFDEIFEIADRVTILRDGRRVATVPREGLTREAMIRWMVGREVSEEFPSRSTLPGPLLLEIRDLSSRGRFDGVSFGLRAGEILGVGGLVGAGRTSLGLALGGALPATGSIRLDGALLRFGSPYDALSSGIAYVTEDRKRRGLHPAMSVVENLSLGSLRRFVRAGLLDRRREREAADAVGRDVRIAGVSLDRRVATLSGGTQQKVLLGRFLLSPPRVLVLDEPTRGVDVGARADIYALLNRLTSRGVGIVMISSDLPELIGMSDRILVMRRGRAAGVLPRGEVSAERVTALAAGA